MGLEKFTIGRGPESVKATLLYMKQMVLKSDSDRIVKSTAHEIIRNIYPGDHLQQVKAITGWVRRKLHYVRDIYGVEEVTNPATMLHNISKGLLSHSSDCDDYAVLLSALLRSVGFPTRLEALAVNGARYDHARVSAYVLGKWLPIEGTKNALEVGVGLPSKLPVMAVEV